jgi:hypothetical protein
MKRKYVPDEKIKGEVGGVDDDHGEESSDKRSVFAFIQFPTLVHDVGEVDEVPDSSPRLLDAVISCVSTLFCVVVAYAEEDDSDAADEDEEVVEAKSINAHDA